LSLSGQGQVVARNMLGYRDRFDDIPFFLERSLDKVSIRTRVMSSAGMKRRSMAT